MSQNIQTPGAVVLKSSERTAGTSLSEELTSTIASSAFPHYRQDE